MVAGLDFDKDRLRDFCQRWSVRRIALFGSVLRDDFRANSDVDVLIDAEESTRWSLLDLAAMQRELAAIFGREVDLLTRRGVEQSGNPYRRREILSSAETLYVA